MFRLSIKSLKISTLLLSLLLLHPCYTHAQTSNISGAFVDIGLGAAPMGMAGSAIVNARDVYSIVTNPAGLTNVANPEMAFSMTKQFSLIPYNLILYSQRMGENSSLGGGLLTSGDDALKENTVYLAFAQKISQQLSVGLNFKYHHANFGDNADGQWIYDNTDRQVKGSVKGHSFDIGVTGKLRENVGFGIVFKDGLGNLNYDASNQAGTAKGGSESMSPMLMLGVGYLLDEKVTFEANLQKSLSEDTNDRFSMGVEKRLFSLFNVRGGISQNIAAVEANRHYSMGLGIAETLKNNPLKFAIDFAYLINDIEDFYHAGLKVAWRIKNNTN